MTNVTSAWNATDEKIPRWQKSRRGIASRAGRCARWFFAWLLHRPKAPTVTIAGPLHRLQRWAGPSTLILTIVHVTAWSRLLPRPWNRVRTALPWAVAGELQDMTCTETPSWSGYHCTAFPFSLEALLEPWVILETGGDPRGSSDPRTSGHLRVLAAPHPQKRVDSPSSVILESYSPSRLGLRFPSLTAGLGFTQTNHL